MLEGEGRLINGEKLCFLDTYIGNFTILRDAAIWRRILDDNNSNFFSDYRESTVIQFIYDTYIARSIPVILSKRETSNMLRIQIILLNQRKLWQTLLENR